MSRKSKTKVGRNVVSTKTIHFGNGVIPGGCPGVITKKKHEFVTVRFDYYDQAVLAEVDLDSITISNSHP